MKTTLAALGSAVALCLALTACGGGGGTEGTPLASGNAPWQTAGKDGSADASKLQAPELADNGLSLTAQIVDESRDQRRPSDAAVRPSGADHRNGAYVVYAANGTEQLLSLNFDFGTYMMTDTSSQGTAGAFSQDPLEPDVWIFDSPRITATVNTARFQLKDDTIVGSFPFRRSDSAEIAHAVQPFVAVRSFVTDRRQLEGVYNVVGIAVGLVKGFASSQIQQISIDGGGTQLKFCAYTLLYSPGGCAGADTENYWVTRDPSGAWQATRPGYPHSQFKFRMARIGGQNVFLAANPFSTPGYPPEDYQRLSIGLPDVANWRDPLKARIYASDGGRGSAMLDAAMYSASTLQPDASSKGFAYDTKIVSGTQGVQQLNVAGNERFFAVRNDTFVALVGTPAHLGTRGYMQIGLIDGPSTKDPRSGTYKVFAGLGTQHSLTIDPATRSYSTTDEAGVSVSGTFVSDSDEPGTYIFNSDRIKSAINTARFRLAADTVVGAFPFPTRPLGDVFQVQPFIASRAIASTQSTLDGTYNRFTLYSDNGYLGPRVNQQIRIMDGGTTMVACNDARWEALYTVDNCPAASRTTYVISQGATAGAWSLKDPSLDQSSPGFFRKSGFSIIKVAGQKVYVTAEPSDAGSFYAAFRIGVEEASAWQAVSARGGVAGRVSNVNSAADSSWSNASLDANWFERTTKHPDGTQSALRLPLFPSEPTSPQGVQLVGSLTFGNQNVPMYMVMQNKGLAVFSGRAGIYSDFGMLLTDRVDEQ